MSDTLLAADLQALQAGVRAGDRRAVARALRLVDDAPAVGRRVAAALSAPAARVIGITGNPGAGKSTLVDSLVAALRVSGKRVAVLAVDPSSPLSGGALLGDRIRMGRHAVDDGVFIRSLATRGALGGLSAAALDSIRVLAAAGFDVILLETVGVGQDEVDIARFAHSTVVVLAPGLGDDVQAIKAGLLEIADLLVINKADREGADELEQILREMQTRGATELDWTPPILRSVATRGDGVAELMAALDVHERYLRGDRGRARRSAQAGEVFERLLDAALVEVGRQRLATGILQAKQRAAEGGEDPYTLVRELIDHDAVTP